MLYYEMKKIFCRTGSKTALLLLLLILCLVCGFAVNVSYVNEQGETEHGPAALRKLRAARKEWAGVLDEDMLRQVIEENVRISATPEANSKELRQNEIAYSWKQGLSDIRDLLNSSFAVSFREYDYYRADSLSPEDASSFYSNRTILLKNWLDTEAQDQFSQSEKDYLIRRYEALETPFSYDYMTGWIQLQEYAPTMVMITILILGYLTAGIFSNEFVWKSDMIFFTARYGRDKAVRAKLQAGFLTVTGLYWILMLLYTAVLLLYLGADGAHCPIQASRSCWKSFYSLTNLQACLLILRCGYLAALFVSFLTMLVSAKTRSSVIAVTIPFLLIFLPSFISNISSPVVNKILGLLPDQLMQAGKAICYFNLYSLGGRVMGALPILMVLYPALTLILAPVLYGVYRRKEIV